MPIEDQLILLSRDTKVSSREKVSGKTWRKSWKKKSKFERVILWIMLVIFAVYGFSLMFPVIWALVSSFKTGIDFDNNPFGLPQVWTLENYQNLNTLFTKNGYTFIEVIWNSIWMSTLSTVLGIASSSLTAYVVAKYRFKGSGFLYALAIFIQIIPLVGSTAGMYHLLHTTLQIANKPLLIWPIWMGGFGFSFLMLYGAFKSVPWSYAESAFIDGAGHFKTFFKIMLPAVKPVLGSLFIVNFINAWNDYMTAYLYIDNYPPLSLLVYNLSDAASRMDTPSYFAVIIISLIPTLLLFIAFQKVIMENTTTGGLKG